MADVFEDRGYPIPHRETLRLIDDTPALNWLLLTKRPENIKRLAPRLGQPNVWLGVSAENQQDRNLRVPILMDIPRWFTSFRQNHCLRPSRWMSWGLIPNG